MLRKLLNTAGTVLALLVLIPLAFLLWTSEVQFARMLVIVLSAPVGVVVVVLAGVAIFTALDAAIAQRQADRDFRKAAVRIAAMTVPPDNR